MKNLKAYIAEAIGTFVLVFCACGVAAATDGNLVPTALAFGLVIVAMAYSIGRISGCHINPAVSLGCLLAGRMTLKDFLGYVIAQVLGGFVGALALFGFAKMGGMELAGNACNGVIGAQPDAVWNAGNVLSAVLVEVVLTFIFVYVILNVTDAKSEATKNSAGIIIGLTLTLVHLLGINFTGTSVNPARSIATALGALIFNNDVNPMKPLWIFIVAPLLGAALAALAFKQLNENK